MNVFVAPLVAGLGWPELLIIVGIIVLLFGAAKLPDLARGSGRALRIFKAETKGLLDDEDDEKKTQEQRQLEATNRTQDEARDRAVADEPERREPGPTV